MRMTVDQLITSLQTLSVRGLGSAFIEAEGFNEMGDLTKLPIRGDIRVVPDDVGNPIVVLR